VKKLFSYLERFIFGLLWLGIGFTSAYDAYLAIKYRDTLAAMEKNPIGLWLMSLDGGDVSLFMGIKFAGTVLVLGILVFCYIKNKGFAWGLIIPLVIFNALLLAYLKTGFHF
jgi:hypothetical protein